MDHLVTTGRVVVIHFAATLCERGSVDPRAIIQLSCDRLAAPDLRRAITIGRDLTTSSSTAPMPTRLDSVWLIDEAGEDSAETSHGGVGPGTA